MWQCQFLWLPCTLNTSLPSLLPLRSDQLDVMACCKGDYGLFYRASAGWLRGGPAERAVLGPAELRAPGQRRLTLWPFDRRARRAAGGRVG